MTSPLRAHLLLGLERRCLLKSTGPLPVGLGDPEELGSPR